MSHRSPQKFSGKVSVFVNAEAKKALFEESPLAEKEIRNLGAYVRRQAKKTLRLLSPLPFQVTFSLVDDGEIRKLNAQWRQLDRVTDVLSFPQMSPQEIEEVDASDPTIPEGPPLLLGDVVIAPATVLRRGEEVTFFHREMSRVVIHGLLHLMGWDHKQASDREKMRAKERELLEAVS